MKKFAKRLLWAILTLLVLLIAAAIVVPTIFKPQLMRVAKAEINKSVNAKVEFTDFQVSLIKGFPNLYIGLKGLSVVGIDSFVNDTLVAFGEFSVRVDLWSALGMKNIEVKSILLDRPRLTARVAKDGRANWDIAKPSEADETETDDTTAGSPVDTRVALKQFEIRDAHIAYIDDSSGMQATVQGLNLLLSGSMGTGQTDLTLNTTVDALGFRMDGLNYVRDAELEFNATIGANMDSALYTFKENSFRVNQLALLFEGTVKMPDNGMDIDIRFNTPATDFKAILSMIPAIYMKDFAGLKTSGRFGIEGFVKGVMGDSSLPNASVALLVENGMFQYPNLPKSVSNVNISTKVWFDGTNMDNTTVSVDKFHLELGGNPFDARLHMATPMSDMQVDGNITGKIDFASLADVVPLDSTSMAGVLDANLDFAGKLSYIEKEQYQKFKADGSLRLANFVFTGSDFPQGIRISETVLNFSPRFVDLAKFDSQIGKSDLKMNGRLENFIPFIFKDETVRGSLNLSSTLFDANEFLGGKSSTGQVAEQDSSAMGVIEIPRNISFNTKAHFARIIYDKLDITNLSGLVAVEDGIASMTNLSMNLLDGSMVMGGSYSSQDANAPKADFDFNMKGIDIPSAFGAFASLQKMAPAAKDMTGRVSAQFKFKSTLDTAMMPVLNSIDAYGKLQSDEIGFKDSKVFGKIADLVKNDKFRNPAVKDVNISFRIKEGRVHIDPFDTKLVDTKMTLGGDMGLDQTLNFKAKMAIPSKYAGAAADLLGSLTGVAVPRPNEDVKLNFRIGGTSSNPSVGLDKGEAPSGGASATAKEVVGQQVEEARAEVKNQAREQADKLIADAEKEAARLRAEAATLADRIRAEAEEQAKKTEEEGKKKGPIAERVAKEAAKEIRKKGEAAAQKAVQEADAKANQLMEKANAEAAKLE